MGMFDRMGVKGAIGFWIGAAVVILLGVVIGVIIQSAALNTSYLNSLPQKALNSDDEYFAQYEGGKEVCTTRTHRFSFLNMTNSQQVMQDNAAANYVEVGPYIYTREVCRYDVQLNGDETEYTYREYYGAYKLVSGGNDETDVIVNVNPAFVKAMAVLGNVAITDIQAILDGPDSGLIVGRTVKQWLWGATDPLLTYANVPNTVALLACDYCPATKAEADALPPVTQTNVYRGGATSVTELDPFLRVSSMNGTTVVTGVYAEDVPVDGYVGTYFPPGVTDDAVFPVWSNTLMRPVPFVFMGDYEERALPMKRFGVAESFWQSQTDHADNAKFYQTYQGFAVLPRQRDFGLVLSLPHFHGASDAIAQSVTGLEPSRNNFSNWYIGVEAESGTVLRSHINAQVNVQHPAYPNVYNFSAGVHPLFWYDDSVGTTQEQVDNFRSSIVGLRITALSFLVSGPVIGFVLICIGFIAFVLWYRKKGSENEDVELN